MAPVLGGPAERTRRAGPVPSPQPAGAAAPAAALRAAAAPRAAPAAAVAPAAAAAAVAPVVAPQGAAAAPVVAAAPAVGPAAAPQPAAVQVAPERPTLGRRLAIAVAAEGADLLASVAASGLKEALDESELLDMENLLSVAGKGLMGAPGTPQYDRSFQVLVSMVKATAAWASADAGVVFHVESLLHRVVEMAMEARKASLQMRRDIASTRVAIVPGGGVNAPGGGGGEPAPTEEPKPKELNGDEWRVLVSGMLEGQLGSLPDVTVWPIDADLKVTCEGLSGPRPRLAQLTELQLPRLGMESSAGAHVAATKNKVYNHDRAYSAEDELDMFEDFTRYTRSSCPQPTQD